MSVRTPFKTRAILPQPSSLALRVRVASGRDRSGAVLAMVLASLLVASLLGLALIEMVLVHHRQMQVMDRQQQCFWLAEAGIQRAIQRLAESSDYQGEKWEVSAEVLGGPRSAVVAIEVTAAAGSPPAREILVVARLSGDPRRPDACRRTLTVSVPLESAGATGNAENGRSGEKEALPAPKNDNREE